MGFIFVYLVVAYFCNFTFHSFTLGLMGADFAPLTIWYKFVGYQRRRIPCGVHNMLYPLEYPNHFEIRLFNMC
jgi:hypothetical protein